jgi:hypothetical protein
MVANRTTLSAREVHDRLRAALSELQRAERNAVLWFSEIVRRKLYRELGYSSVYQYAELALGFKKSKTSQFLHLSQALADLPELRRSVAKGELSWTKAREVAKIATSETESVWIQEAKQTSSRKLEARVKETRRRARVGVAGRGQGAGSGAGNSVGHGTGDGAGSCGRNSAGHGSGHGTGSGAGNSVGHGGGHGSNGAGHGSAVPQKAATPSVPMDVHLRMTGEQYARYQALIEAIRKQEMRGNRTELVLAGLERLVLEGRVKVQGGEKGKASGKEAGKGDDPISSTRRPQEFTRVNPNVA